jgi:hypothetical protein
MNSKTMFIEAVRTMPTLPASLREHADDVKSLKKHRFDRSYIEFLDEQIRLSPRGPEWTAQLKRRRAALLPFCDEPLLRGSVRVGDLGFNVEIDQKNGTVIHWEEFEYDRAT